MLQRRYSTFWIEGRLSRMARHDELRTVANHLRCNDIFGGPARGWIFSSSRWFLEQCVSKAKP